MPDLTDERVREIAEQRGFRSSGEEEVALARMVLNLRAQLAAVEAAVREVCPLSDNEGFEDDDAGLPSPRYRCLDDEANELIEADTLADAVRQMNGCWYEMQKRCERQAAEAEANDLRADRDTLREFLAALIELHVWQRGAFEHFTSEDIWHHAVHCGLIVPDPHPQPCPIEECECGDYDGKMWRLAWMPATGTQQEEV